MKNMTLSNIAKACGGRLIAPDDKKTFEISGVAIDSRKVKEGFLFIPIKGARVDGHDFIPAVFEAGAGAALSERELLDCPGPYILVNSTETALKEIAAFYRSGLDLTVIGISGSVGKTSTKEMIASILEQHFSVLKTEGNFNNEIGLPLTVFRLREEHEIAVLEMGISDFGEMHRLAAIARPDLCVITNIGQCHLENLKTRDGILKAKTEMFEHMTPGGRVFLNGDDDKLIGVQEVHGLAPLFFGLERGFSAWADKIENLGLKGTSCILHLSLSGKAGKNIRSADIPVTIPIPGAHMVYNALAGASIGFYLGMEPEEIQAGIEALVPVGGRNNLIETKTLKILDDCYNANPVSMRSGIDVLKRAAGRKVCILGDMGELGDNSPALHRETGRYATEAGMDLILLAGPLSAAMAEGAKESAASPDRVRYFADKQALITALPGLIKAGDTILVKASHAMGFEDIVEALRNL